MSLLPRPNKNSSKIIPVVGTILSQGPYFCRKVLPWVGVLATSKKFPGGLPSGGCWCLELTDASR